METHRSSLDPHPARRWAIRVAAASCVLLVPGSAGAGAIDVAAGTYHACAVTTDGAISCWGHNFFGQLGDGTTAQRLEPVGASGLGSGVTAGAAGEYHTCAIAGGGAVWCWGVNAHGQLGNGTTTGAITPVAVTGLGSGVTALAAGAYHTCAVTSGGAAVCWGDNSSGQLGDGTTTTRSTPVPVSGLGSGVVAVAAGRAHTCAVTSGGALWCWGAGSFGQLGDGTSTSRSAPVAVTGLGSGVVAVAGGWGHSCAVTGAGGAWCWGANFAGQLGDGTTTTRPTPVAVSGLGSGVVSVAAGEGHTCAATSTGALACWGGNAFGQLGDGTTTMRRVPVVVPGLANGVVAVDSRSQSTCAVMTDGTVLCWGRNYYGELGDGTTMNRCLPTDVLGLTSGAVLASAGTYFTCAVTGGGGASCWGYNNRGQLGDGTLAARRAPVAVSGLATGVVAVAAGELHACAVTNVGAVWCWGNNSLGQVGNGATELDIEIPVVPEGLGSGMVAVAGGRGHSCAVTSGGVVWCWGNGQLLPSAVGGLSSGAVAITAGDDHVCALTSGGGVWCGGSNSQGELGDGSTTDRGVLVPVTGLGSGVIAISAGGNHSCALTGAGAVWCWGSNADGEIGDGTTTNRLEPVLVSGLAGGVASIAAGSRHTCAVTTAETMRCWGRNADGQLGDGTTTTRLLPVPAAGLWRGVVAATAGNNHTCAITTSGGMSCWGDNFYGQLGDGTVPYRTAPVRVAALPGEAVRYFAEGANGEGMGFETRVALANPNALATWVTLEFFTTSGAQVRYGPLLIGAQQRLTVDTWQDVPGLANASFSTIVRSTLGLVADRTMRWDGTGYASHAETAIVTPSLTWYLAEGATHSGFHLFYLLQNPNPTAATVEITYLRTGQGPLTVTCTLPAKTRKNIYANAQLCPDDVYVGPHPSPDRFVGDDVSAVFTVTNGQPIIVERAMYRGTGFAAGTATAGVTSPATSWFLAEGATGALFDTYVLLANPGDTPAEFQLDLLRLTSTPALISPSTIDDPFFCAPVAAPCPLVVPAHERRTIRLDGIPGAENDGVSSVVRVTNGVGVLVERAMWWPGAYATWTEGHASFGTTTTGTRWALAEGEVGGPREVATYVLVANASAFPARVRATLLFEDGPPAATELTVAANARANFNFTPTTMAWYPELRDLFPPTVVAAGKRFAVVVESLPTGGSPAEIVVERAVYSSDGRAPAFAPYWPAGTNAVGTRLP